MADYRDEHPILFVFPLCYSREIVEFPLVVVCLFPGIVSNYFSDYRCIGE